MRYQVTQLNTNTESLVQVWGSTDGGNTFTELDASNRANSNSAPDGSQGGYYKQGAAFILVVILNGATGFKRCIPFDLSSNTWGAYTPDCPFGLGKVWVTWRPNGDYLVFGNDPSTAGSKGIAYSIYNGSSWSALIPVITGARTDLVIGATPTTVTSAALPFTTSDSGMVLNITGGTGFTPGSYSILTVVAGVATLNVAAGTALSTGGAGYVQLGAPIIRTIIMDDASGTCTISTTQDDSNNPSFLAVVGVTSSNTNGAFLFSDQTQVVGVNAVTNACIFQGKAYFGVIDGSFPGAEARVMITDSASNPTALSYVTIQDQSYLDGTNSTLKIFPSLDGMTLYALWDVFDTRTMPDPPYNRNAEGASLIFSSSTDGVTWTSASIYFQPPFTDPYEIGQYPTVTTNAQGGGGTSFLATASDLGSGVFGATEWKFYQDDGSAGNAQYNLYNNSGTNSFNLIETGPNTNEPLPFSVEFLCAGWPVPFDFGSTPPTGTGGTSATGTVASISAAGDNYSWAA